MTPAILGVVGMVVYLGQIAPGCVPGPTDQDVQAVVDQQIVNQDIPNRNQVDAQIADRINNSNLVGEDGGKGDKGDTGATGPQGNKGDTGDTGATGATGAQGNTGAPGRDGLPGQQGDPGDITGVTAGSGLVGGGDTGNVTVGLGTVALDHIDTTAADTNKIMKFDGSQLVWADDEIGSPGGGDITAVRTPPGSGLSGGRESDAVTLSIAGVTLDKIDTSGASVGNAIMYDENDNVVWMAPGGGPPSGEAGGDLTGTYPNPEIAPGAVTNAHLAPNSVDASKIADNAVGLSELNASGGSDGRFLKHTANGMQWVDGGGISGGGAAGRIPKFTNSTTLGNSVIYESGNNIGIGGTPDPNEKLQVVGDIRATANFRADNDVTVGHDLDVGHDLNVDQEITVGHAVRAADILTVGNDFFLVTASQGYVDINGDLSAYHMSTTDGLNVVGADNGPFRVYYTGSGGDIMRAYAGGMKFKVDSSGNAWAYDYQYLSDREAKRDFKAVDGRDILKRLAAIPIQTWSFKDQDNTLGHIGPVAQDFYRVFAGGKDDRHISSVDANGVALAAIQGLYQVVKDKQQLISSQQEQIDRLGARLKRLEALIARR